MRNVMIIGEDNAVREQICNGVDWSGLDLNCICQTEDRDTAMEQYRNHHPSIIVFDIGNDPLNDLELVGAICREDPNTRILLISDRQHFKWTRQSIRFASVEIMQKPIFINVLNSHLKKISDDLTCKQRQLPQEELNKLISDNLPFLQGQLVMNVLMNPSADVQLIDKRMKMLQIICPGPHYTVGIASLHAVTDSFENNMLLLLMKETLQRNLEERGFVVVSYSDHYDRLNCIISSDSADRDDEIEEIFTNTQAYIQLKTGVHVIVGIGPAVKGLHKIHDSWCGGLAAMNYQAVLGDTGVKRYAHMTLPEITMYSQEAISRYLMKTFRENDLPKLSQIMHDNVVSLIGNVINGNQMVEKFLLNYLKDLALECTNLKITVERFDNYSSAVAHILQADYGRGVEEVLKLTEQVLKNLRTQRTNESNHLLNMAKAYIQDHLSDKTLNLEAVSSHVGLSRIYFCKLFHQMENISFNTYLKQQRIEKAKYLLINTSMKIFEVSDAVGFCQAKYFSFVFKELVGKTPAEYQKSIQNDL